MRTLKIWRNLSPYGIIQLPGPVDAGVRCSVTEKGKTLLESVFGVEITLGPPAPEHGFTPQVGTIRLPTELLVPLSVHALLCEECREVFVLEDGTVMGVETSDASPYAEGVRSWHSWNIVTRFKKDGGLVVRTYRRPY